MQAVDRKLDDQRKVAAQTPLVQAGRKNVKLEVSGWVNRAVNIAGDGRHTKAYFVDNGTSVSRFRIVGTYQPSDDFSVSPILDIGVRPNVSSQVSQTNESPGDSFDQRRVEVLFKSKAFGSLYLGKGDPAAKDATKSDLSGTDVLAEATVADPAGGLLFVDPATDRYGTTNVAAAFPDFDPGRQNRVRYDTPALAGFTVSGSYSDNERYGGAVRWAGEFGGFKGAASFAYHDPNLNSVSHVLLGSASLLHTATGLSLTAAAGQQDRNDYNPWYYYVKAGWQADLLPWGKTAFSLDYDHHEDRPARDDEGRSIGLAAVQNLTDLGTELYAGVRWYDLSVDAGPDPDGIYVGTVGARVRF